MKYTQIAGRFYNRPLYVTEEMARQIEDVIERKENGVSLDAATLAEIREEARINAKTVNFKVGTNEKTGEDEYVATVPLIGPLVNRSSTFSQVSGMSSYLNFAEEMRDAADNPSVKAIVMDVDSPGGEVGGVHAAQEAVKYAASKKNVIAVANSLMASAAYYVSSAASEIVADPTSDVGSIGVVLAHRDTTAAEEKAGVKTTYIKAGKHKADGAMPLTSDSKKHFQESVNESYNQFLQIVASNRNLSVSSLRGENQDGIADGSIYSGKRAVELGLADRIGTMHDVVSSFDTQADTESFKMAKEASTTKEAEILSEMEEMTNELEQALFHIEQLSDELEEKEARIKELETMIADSEEKEATERACALVDTAVAEGKVLSQSAERLKAEAVENFEAVKLALDSIRGNSAVPMEDLELSEPQERQEFTSALAERVKRQLEDDPEYEA